MFWFDLSHPSILPFFPNPLVVVDTESAVVMYECPDGYE
jgi:hypothetical protein